MKYFDTEQMSKSEKTSHKIGISLSIAWLLIGFYAATKSQNIGFFPVIIWMFIIYFIARNIGWAINKAFDKDKS